MLVRALAYRDTATPLLALPCCPIYVPLSVLTVTRRLGLREVCPALDDAVFLSTHPSLASSKSEWRCARLALHSELPLDFME